MRWLDWKIKKIDRSSFFSKIDIDRSKYRLSIFQNNLNMVMLHLHIILDKFLASEYETNPATFFPKSISTDRSISEKLWSIEYIKLDQFFCPEYESDIFYENLYR